VSNPGISPLKHAKKCVFGVFLKHTRIALVCKNEVIDIILESGARGRNRTTDTRIFNIDGSREFSEYSMLYLQETGVHKSVSWSF